MKPVEEEVLDHVICFCGKPKKMGKLLCDYCYTKLPHSLRRLIYRDGAYTAALELLQEKGVKANAVN